jgi:magnesium-transporting ATPase (P-type)
VRSIWLMSGEHLEVTGEGFAPRGQVLRDGEPLEPGELPTLGALARASVLCNEAALHQHGDDWVWRGDTVDVALLSMAHKLGWKRESTLEHHPQIDAIPYEPVRQLAASYHEVEGDVRIYVKGAPERILAMCDGGDGDEAMRIAEDMAGRGLRVLAIASGEGSADHTRGGATEGDLAGLSLLGFVGMLDPLRAGVPEAVRACHDAGVDVIMVTGDHPITALAIARQLEMADDPGQVVTGADLADRSPEELAEATAGARVFARVSPHQKLQIVKAAQHRGDFVGVTGDGVNDAPALRAANIGVAMGRSGTDVAREAAGLVISDDNFATIVAGIQEGRIAYDNIRKVIYLLISTGAAELVMVALSVLFGLPLPLLPVQLLWLNLVTNGIQDIALAFEPGEPTC